MPKLERKEYYNIINPWRCFLKSFKEYSKQTSTDETAKERQSKQTETVAEDLTKRIAEAYNGRSNADMMQNILMY